MAKKPERSYFVGFDLGGTKMLAKVYDAQFKERGRKRRKTEAREGAAAGLRRVAATIRDALRDAGVRPVQVLAIGMGCPGPLDPERGILLDLPNLGWKNVGLKSALEKQFGCPVFVANDVDAGVYGEYTFGAARGAHCVLGVFPGTGIGGGCVHEGRILRGASRSAMEIGHLRVLPDGPLCGCGRRGCLESVASRLAISAAAASAAFRGEAPHLLKNAGMDLSDIRSGTLARAVQAGDAAIERIVRDAARWVGIGIAGAVNLLAPDVIVLGGGLVEAMPDLYLKEVRDAVRSHVMPPFAGTFKVVLSRLGDDAVAAGAAAWAARSLQPRARGETERRP